jgi:dienelactone hydrolase
MSAPDDGGLNMLGAYGQWAASLVPAGPARYSFRGANASDVAEWRRAARSQFRSRLMQPDAGGVPHATVQHAFEFDGLAIEHLSWQLPYGPPTEAWFLKPVGSSGRLPGVLALHDHGGKKYFGTRKITRTSSDLHPLVQEHQEEYYGGVAWANELARRGYAVLVHDAFAFASRRFRLADLPPVIAKGLREVNPESTDEIEAYHRFAHDHEHLIAKSLFCAGTTWPGVFTAEDQRALDYLLSRPDVDPDRVGCGGLSGGGLRTVYLAGLDERIRCACCAGMMTTWRDYLLHKCYTHTWMIYVPGLPWDMDYPEILGINVPAPCLVLNCEEDPLFTLPEMRRAQHLLDAVYARAGAADRCQTVYQPGGHRFDLDMQKAAFDWFDRWLKG